MSDGFHTTRWSVVLTAGRGEAGASEALEWLCKTYWYPLYAFVRRQGHDADEARDLTQSFFVDLLERSALARADPARGRFRAFLLTSIKNFIANQAQRERAVKRRADDRRFRVDLEGAEGRYSLEPSAGMSPDEVFESRWARTVIDRVLFRLEEEHEAAGKGEVFRRLRGQLMGEEPAYDRTAEDLGTTPGALRVTVHRLRRRLGALLREEVAQTVADVKDIDAEVRSLLQSAGRGV